MEINAQQNVKVITTINNVGNILGAESSKWGCVVFAICCEIFIITLSTKENIILLMCTH